MYAWPPWPLPLTPGRGQWCDTNVARASTTSAQSRVVTQLLACKPNQDVFFLDSPTQDCSHYRRRQQPRVSRRSGCFNLAWFPHSRSKTQPRDQVWPSFVVAIGNVASSSTKGRYMLCARLHHYSQSKRHVCQARQQTLQPFRLRDSSTGRWFRPLQPSWRGTPLCNTRMCQERNPQQQVHTPPARLVPRMQPDTSVERHSETTQQ
jgi:hypothetical protein